MRVCLIQIGDNYITKQVRTIILVMGSATRAQSCGNDFLVEFFRTAARHKAAPYLKQTTFNSKILAVSKTRKAMRFSGLNTNGGETTIASITITGPFDKGGKSPYQIDLLAEAVYISSGTTRIYTCQQDRHGIHNQYNIINISRGNGRILKKTINIIYNPVTIKYGYYRHDSRTKGNQKD